jgi:hypothetical protein
MRLRFRLLGALFAVCLIAMAQTKSMSVNELVVFLKNQLTSRDHRYTDLDVANFLGKVKLTDRLEDRTIEDLESQFKVGPKTLAKLRVLRDQSQGLVAARIAVPERATPIPPPSSEEQAAVLDDVRKYALAYSRNLPDFICTEVTRRYGALAPGTHGGGAPGDDPHWQALDTLTKRLSYFNQKEEYKTIMHNATMVSDQAGKGSFGGSESFGDFGTMMKEVFEPATEAHFEWDHWGTLRGQRVMEFSFRVQQSRSQYSIMDVGSGRSIIAGYKGIVAVDPETHVVLRVKLQAENIPADFPVRSTEDILDYDYQEISGQQFLLPIKGTVTANLGDQLARNDKEFRIYRKYSADAVIKYDTDIETPAPLDENKTKETPAKPPAKKGGSQ